MIGMHHAVNRLARANALVVVGVCVGVACPLLKKQIEEGGFLTFAYNRIVLNALVGLDRRNGLLDQFYRMDIKTFAQTAFCHGLIKLFRPYYHTVAVSLPKNGLGHIYIFIFQAFFVQT